MLWSREVTSIEIPLYNYNRLMLPLSVRPFIEDLEEKGDSNIYA